MSCQIASTPCASSAVTTELSLGRLLARSAELGREILEFRKAIPHREDGFGVVDVDARTELERRQRGGEPGHQSPRRGIGHQMPIAFLAVLPLAHRRLLIHADV